MKKFLIIFLILIFVLGLFNFLKLDIERVLAQPAADQPLFQCPNLTNSDWCPHLGGHGWPLSTCVGQIGIDTQCTRFVRGRFNPINCIEDTITCPRVGEPVAVDFVPFEVAVGQIYHLFLVFTSIIAVAILAFAGFRFMTSAGDPEAITDAKKWLLSLLVGLLIVVFSYALVRTLEIDIEVPDPPDLIIIPTPIPDPADDPLEDILDIIPEDIYDIPEEIPPNDEELREDRFVGFVLRRWPWPIERRPLIVEGERLIIRDLSRVFDPATGHFRDFTGAIISIHSPRDKHGNFIYRFGIIAFEDPNFRGPCTIRVDRHGLVEGALAWLARILKPIDGMQSIRSFVMPMESLYRLGDNLMTHEHSILEATYFRPNPITGEEIVVGKHTIDPGFLLKEIKLRQKARVEPILVPSWPRPPAVIAPQPTYSLKTNFQWPGKYLMVLRYSHPGWPAPSRCYCHITLKSVPDFRNLWWTHAENPQAFFQEQAGRIEIVGSPETIQIAEVLRVY